MQDEVKVTHADREAAWPYAGFHCLPDRQMHERWFSGYYDNLGQGQAIRDFARHRHQAERDTLARMEPVAWMYEYRGGVVAVTATRYDRGTIKALGYVETPLYALPPAPEAGQ